MSNPIKRPAELEPRGPEGVPVDAPDNDAPALSPLAVSRMHRGEDDDEAFAHSPEYTDDRSVAEDRRDHERHPDQWDPATPAGRPQGTDTPRRDA